MLPKMVNKTLAINPLSFPNVNKLVYRINKSTIMAKANKKIVGTIKCLVISYFLSISVFSSVKYSFDAFVATASAAFDSYVTFLPLVSGTSQV